MKELGLKGVDITKATGVSSGGVSQWTNGMTKPSGERLISLSKILECSPEWLVTGEEPSGFATPHGYQSNTKDIPSASIHESTAGYTNASNTQSRSDALVPLITWTKASSLNETPSSITTNDVKDWTCCMATHSDHTYSLTVQGDSMTTAHGPSFPEGCIIFVDPSQKDRVAHGDKVIASVRGEDMVTFKVFVEEAGKKMLKPLNPQYPMITEPHQVIGKVIGMWMPL